MRWLKLLTYRSRTKSCYFIVVRTYFTSHLAKKILIERIAEQTLAQQLLSVLTKYTEGQSFWNIRISCVAHPTLTLKNRVVRVHLFLLNSINSHQWRNIVESCRLMGVYKKKRSWKNEFSPFFFFFSFISRVSPYYHWMKLNGKVKM